jgi:hypothetical protein
VSLLCSIGGHSASGQRIRNAGHHFARCARCNADLVESEGRWATAPRGFRVIWKAVPDKGAELVLELEDEFEPDVRPALETAEEEQPEAELHPERRGLERRVNRYALAYKGIERRRDRDRRQSFGKKTASS